MTYSGPFSASRSSGFPLRPVDHQGQDSKDGSVDGSFFRELLTRKLFGRQGRLPYWILDTRLVVSLWRAGINGSTELAELPRPYDLLISTQAYLAEQASVPAQ